MNEDLRCPYCGSRNIVRDYETGTLYCANCGAILGEFAVEFRPIISPEESLQKRLRPEERVTEEKEKLLVRKYEDIIRGYMRRLGIPNHLYSQIMDYFLAILRLKKKIPRDLIKYYAAAIIYITARQNNVPLSLKKIIRTMHLEHEKFSKVYRFISQNLKVKLKPIEPYSYMDQIMEKLKLNDPELRREARMLLDEGRNRGMLSGRDIRGVIAGILYVVARGLGIHLTQKEIAKACDITEVTVRNRFIEFAKLYEELTGRKIDMKKRTRKKRLRVKL